MSKLLIYIPCHLDFDSACEQAKKARIQFEELELATYGHELAIVLSVNNFCPTTAQLECAEKYSDEVIKYGNSFLYDANICLGFTVALRSEPDYFWILSTNDYLQPSALTTIFETFESSHAPDLIIANSLNQVGPFRPISAINPQLTGHCTGLISGVSYRYETTKDYYNAASFYTWTGWGHLAVIESYLQGTIQPRVVSVKDSDLYKQIEQGLESNRKTYAHGFYGMVSLIYIFSLQSGSVKKNVRYYLISNFYKFEFFSRRGLQPSALIQPDNYLVFNQHLAEKILTQTGFLNFIIYRILCRFPWYRLERFSQLSRIHRKYKRRFG